MLAYCDTCGREVQGEIQRRMETFPVLEDSITVKARVLVCPCCGNDLFCEELDSASLRDAYNKYRLKHRLLYPDEIKSIREQYGLDQETFAKLLGWDPAAIRRYENGSLQDQSRNTTLQFLQSPENMLTYLEQNKPKLDRRRREALLRRISELQQDRLPETAARIARQAFPALPCLNNGFKAFDFDKFAAMVLFFSSRFQGVPKVKLLKLLNYSDMLCYQANGVSMSGASYVHFPYGPVPQNYELLFGLLELSQTAHIEITFENGYEKHLVLPDKVLPPDALTPEELDILEQVNEYFIGFGSADISDYSHREAGYQATKPGEVISYAYAKDIRLGGR